MALQATNNILQIKKVVSYLSKQNLHKRTSNN